MQQFDLQGGVGEEFRKFEFDKGKKEKTMEICRI